VLRSERPVKLPYYANGDEGWPPKSTYLTPEQCGVTMEIILFEIVGIIGIKKPKESI